jgi:hypothetical protein
MFTVYFLVFGLSQLLVFQNVIGFWFVSTSVFLLLLMNIVLKNSFKWYHKITLPKGTTIFPYSNKVMIVSMIINITLILISVFDIVSGIITLSILTIIITITDLYYLNPVLIFLGYNVYKVKIDTVDSIKTYWLIGKMSIEYPYYKPIELLSDRNVVRFSNKVIFG